MQAVRHAQRHLLHRLVMCTHTHTTQGTYKFGFLFFFHLFFEGQLLSKAGRGSPFGPSLQREL